MELPHFSLTISVELLLSTKHLGGTFSINETFNGTSALVVYTVVWYW